MGEQIYFEAVPVGGGGGQMDEFVRATFLAPVEGYYTPGCTDDPDKAWVLVYRGLLSDVGEGAPIPVPCSQVEEHLAPNLMAHIVEDALSKAHAFYEGPIAHNMPATVSGCAFDASRLRDVPGFSMVAGVVVSAYEDQYSPLPPEADLAEIGGTCYIWDADLLVTLCPLSWPSKRTD